MSVSPQQRHITIDSNNRSWSTV